MFRVLVFWGLGVQGFRVWGLGVWGPRFLKLVFDEIGFLMKVVFDESGF